MSSWISWFAPLLSRGRKRTAPLMSCRRQGRIGVKPLDQNTSRASQAEPEMAQNVAVLLRGWYTEKPRRCQRGSRLDGARGRSRCAHFVYGPCPGAGRGPAHRSAPIRPGTVGVWLAKEQAGDKAAALDDWVALPNDLPGDEEWAPDLKQRIGEFTFDSNFDAAREIRPPDEAAESDALGRREEEESERAGSPPPERLNARVSGNAAVGGPIAFPRSAAWSMASRLVSRDPRGTPKAG